MISRRITKHRTGRRFITAIAATGLLAGSMLASGTALAVHDEGVFQLDGNALLDTATDAEPQNPQSNQTGDQDWDTVTYAEASSFVTDSTLSGGLAGAGDSILTGGATKDINDLEPSWLWKQTATTSVQDKDDIEHAYAAQYIVDKSGATEQCGSSGPTANCVLLYFGADRFSNSGDAVMGFWFFKSKIEKLGPDANGNGTFTGNHTAATATDRGDILVVTDFRSGGKAPSIQVYEWVASGGSASTHLNLIGGGDNPASCTQAPPEKNNGTPIPPVGANDNFCATANQSVVHSPWAFTPKANSGGTGGAGGGTTAFGVAEFMEGGINMTALGLGNTCFSTFLAETRSSHSVTSTLSDFTLGGFGACTSTFATQASKTSLTLGEAAPTDTASLDVSGGGGNPPAPTGIVSFYLCGPSATAITVCDPTGLTAFDTKNLSGANHVGSIYSVTSIAPTITQAGYYCFAARWPGDGNYTDGPYGDDGTNECFVVNVITTTTSTVQKWTPNDTATIATAGPVGYNLTGSVLFELFGPNDTTCAGTAKYVETVNIPASAGLSEAVSTTNGDGAGSGLAADFFVVVGNEGTYSWRVTYTPAASDTAHTGSSSACNVENTSVDITQP